MPNHAPSAPPAQRLADELWAEHGWDLTAADLMGLLLAIFTASALFGAIG